ncbi:hypothetical protein [Rodentibacter myodis]|uniref:Uncharacterized protein n=1 Tax=Rodentibacter myodis TaxID=1907939 RepID=A0A1V3JRR1_9PAST|nr:hypothetical protein [Rodentibacter myodis]OOF59336.1 hypothetical protein BKL49_04485 [Rodentibacter myodis]
MKPKRAKNAFFQEKNSFTDFLKGTAGWLAVGALLAVMILIAFRPAYANPTDWHNHELSEQISHETRCELKGGVYENGLCLPPNLTPQVEQELLHYTAQKQAEIDLTLGVKK